MCFRPSWELLDCLGPLLITWLLVGPTRTAEKCTVVGWGRGFLAKVWVLFCWLVQLYLRPSRPVAELNCFRQNERNGLFFSQVRCLPLTFLEEFVETKPQHADRSSMPHIRNFTKIKNKLKRDYLHAPRAEPSAVAKTKNRPAGGGLAGRTAIVVGSVAASVLCMQHLPERMWGLLVVVSTPALLAVQLPQIWKNWRQKHTGELATLTVFLACMGSSIRVGTTIAVSCRT